MSLLAEYITFAHLHHAYLIKGERKPIISELMDLFANNGVSTKGNPDLHLHECDTFLLEDAHELRREQSLRGNADSKKLFVVAFNTMTSEAENALLKTIEEPTPDTHFFFVTRTGETLATTVRSRLFVIDRIAGSPDTSSAPGEAFLHASIPERLKFVERFTKVKADEKSAAKEEARVLLGSLERAMYAYPSHVEQDFARSLSDVLMAKRYLSDRSPSLKLLLEHLALSIPRTKE